MGKSQGLPDRDPATLLTALVMTVATLQDCLHDNPAPVEKDEGKTGGGGEREGGGQEYRSSPSLTGEGTWTRPPPNRKIKRKFRKRSVSTSYNHRVTIIHSDGLGGL